MVVNRNKKQTKDAFGWNTPKFFINVLKFAGGLLFFAILATAFGHKTNANTWSQTFSDNFNRSNGAIGNGWIDAQSVGSVSSNQLSLTANGDIINGVILRPTGESAIDQRATVDFLPNNPNGSQIWMVFRTQTPGTEYIIGYNGSLTFGAFTSGSLSIIGSPSSLSSFSSSDKYTLDAQVTGTNPTTLSATLTDDTTSTVVGSSSHTDSTSGLQQSGQFGMFANGTGIINDILDNVVYYEDAPTPAWYQEFADSFTRSDGAIGNGWTDSQSVGAVSSDHLNLTANGDVVNGIILRPTNQSGLDQRATADLLANNPSGSQMWMAFRTQIPGTEYLIGLNSQLGFAVIENGSLSLIGSEDDLSQSYDPTHKYTLDAQVTGTNPTTLAATITDDTASTVVASDTRTDSTANLQQAGQFGMFTNANTTPTTLSLDNIIYYEDTPTTTATSYTFTGPGTTNISATSSNFIVSPNGVYTGTITPSDNGGAGTFAPLNLTFASSSAPSTFTYTPSTLGTKTISVSSSPGLTNPSSTSLSVIDPNAGKISVNNSNLIWSPYNWHFNGSTWAETQPGGGYVKIAFTGNTLGINVDTTALTESASGVVIHAYIDGTTTPISKTLADASGNQIIFSNSLGAGNHYAIIYNSVTPCGCNTRWTNGQNGLRLTGIQLANDYTGNILSLASTPLAKYSRQAIFYGDSITEGYDDSGAENSYAARLARLLGIEYGQAGYRAGGYETAVDAASATFYNIGDTTGSWWAGYDNSLSRLNGGTPSGGYKDGIPAVVFNNLGINDAAPGASTSTLRTKITDWLVDERTTIGSYPAIIVLMPYSLSDPDYVAWTSYNPQDYKNAINGAISDYLTAHPNDHRVYMVDLGSTGFSTFASDIVESVHPNDAGAAQIASLLYPLVKDLIISPVTSVSSVSAAASSTGGTFTWTTDAPASSYINFGLTSAYSASTTETDNATTTRTTSHSIIISNFNPCATYHYEVISRDLAQDVASSTDQTMSTLCAGSSTISTSTSQTITTVSGGSISFDGTTITVPSGYSATTTSATFQANQLAATPFFASAGTPSGKTAVGATVIDLKAFLNATSTLPTFTQPISVTLPYNSGDITGLDSSSLTIYRYDSGTSWTALSGCSVNTSARTVTCQTSNFSDFALFGGTSPTVSTPTTTAGGGGLPAVAYLPPIAPPGGFEVSAQQSGTDVSVTSNAGSDVKYVAFSSSTDFSGSVLIPYQQTIQWNPCTELLNCNPNISSLYAVFYTSWGQKSNAVSATVSRNSGSATSGTTVSFSQGSLINPPTLVFKRQLTVNSKGADVSALQTFLAEDPSIYPSGLVTGYFGSATLKAVKAFQVKYGIANSKTRGYGVVGPATRAKLNDWGNF